MELYSSYNNCRMLAFMLGFVAGETFVLLQQPTKETNLDIIAAALLAITGAVTRMQAEKYTDYSNSLILVKNLFVSYIIFYIKIGDYIKEHKYSKKTNEISEYQARFSFKSTMLDISGEFLLGLGSGISGSIMLSSSR